MATNREQQVGHMTGFPPAVYPFAFNSMRSHSPFDLLANSSLFGRFGADLPKEMAALCKSLTYTAASHFPLSDVTLFHFHTKRPQYSAVLYSGTAVTHHRVLAAHLNIYGFF